MSTLSKRAGGALCALVLTLAATACGSGGSSTGSGAGADGGTLEVLSNDDFDSIDPGLTYYQLTYEWLNTAQRSLYAYEPGDAATQVPDIASGPPQISADAKTITVKLKPDVRFSPPVNRAVTSDDVKYAIERGFSKQVGNFYAGTYFGDLVGAPTPAAGNYRPIPGILTPDAHTIVFKLTKPVAAFVSQALVLPLTAPVPRAYARPFDRHQPSQYGMHQVATGPYMVQLVGGKANYQPGKRLVLVRNPNWNSATDFRPAHVNSIDWKIGGDPTVTASQVLAGSHLIDADSPPPEIVKRAVQQAPGQIKFTPSGNRYVTLNTAIPPFDNINLRKAVNAAIDKTQLQLTRGGETTGFIATHYLPPGSPGFEQAGGLKGPGYDFDRSPTGDMAVATRYMKAAGFPSGRYKGPPILVVAGREQPSNRTAEAVNATLRKLGFDTKLRELSTPVMQNKFCAVPKAKVNVCPNGGAVADFADGEAYLDINFDGTQIASEQNANWSQLNDPAINAAMAKASGISDPAARARAWAKIDDMITASAAAVPWLWDKLPNIASKDVNGVIAKWNGAWDLSFTSLK